MIEINNVSKSYNDKQVLAGISLKLPDSGIARIMGRSGEGKTTLLNIIAGIEKPDSGSVRVSGRVSMVFQEDRLLRWESAIENVRLAASGDRSPEMILDELGLGRELHTRVKELSGGMARRVAIARCLAHEADIYIMDEPMHGLDQETATITAETIRRYTKDGLLLVVTHDPDEFSDADMTVKI